MSPTSSSTRKPVHHRGPRWLRSFGFQVTVALALGIAVGVVARQLGPSGAEPNGLTATLDTIGGAYVSLLKAAVIPLVFLAIVSSIGNLRRVTNAARLAGQTLLWFGITALIAVSIGIALGVIIQPGKRTTAPCRRPIPG